MVQRRASHRRTMPPQPVANTVMTVTSSIQLTPFAITLPSPWSVEHFSAAAWQSQLQRQQEDKPTLAHYFRILRAVETVETGVVLTWPTASTTELTMLAVVAPVADLSLQTYLTEATTELEQSRLTVGSGLRLTSAQIRYDLHEAQLPVAMLSFTLPQSGPPGSPSQPEQRVQGYQVAMLDPAGSHLLLLTFISRDPMPDLAEKLMEAIIATVAIP
jgi:hypothetical protein